MEAGRCQGEAGQCRQPGQEVAGSRPGPLPSENLQPKADPDSSMRERRLLQGRIHSWQQELGKERGVLEEEGLRTELR